MKTKTIILILIIFTTHNIYSQSMVWGQSGGQTLPIDLDKTSDGVLLTTTNCDDVNGLQKFDSDGNLVWDSTFLGSFGFGCSDILFLDSEVDENDSIYSLIDLDSSPINVNGITIESGVSLLKIDINGNLVWSEKISELVSLTDINLLYNNGNIFILGNFLAPVTINDTITLTTQQYWDCFSLLYRDGIDYYIAKFNPMGDLIDAISFGTEHHDYIVSATIDENSNIYFTGGSGFTSCTVNYTHITKYNSNLQLQWEKEISREENGSWMIYPSNIYYSEISSKLYLWAYSLGEVIHSDYNIPRSPCADRSDALGAGSNLIEFESSNGGFIKYRHYPNCTVNSLWQFGGNLNSVIINKAGIVESDDNLIILSSIHGSMEFDNGTFESTHLISQFNEFIWDENLFLMKVNKDDFNSEFIASFPGEEINEYPESIDNPNKLLLDSSDLYLSATFQSDPINIFGSSVENISDNNYTNVLIAKIDIGNILSTEDNNEFISDLNVYPNPASDFIFFKSSTEEISKVKVFSITGKVVIEFEPSVDVNKLNVSGLANGLYIIKLIFSNNNTSLGKILINNR